MIVINKRQILFETLLGLIVLFLVVLMAKCSVNACEIPVYQPISIEIKNSVELPMITGQPQVVNSDIKECMLTDHEVAMPMTSGLKSYMSYTAITKESSPQYKLQQISYTGNFGIRMCNDRYVIAVGNGVEASVGTVVDLVLENGTIIPCIVGDLKANKDTDAANLVSLNGCCSEFIIDKSAIDSRYKRSGDVSDCINCWKSRVVKIIVYEINVLKGGM